MQELWPRPEPDVDIAARLGGDDRPKPHGRPWVCLVMIEAIDGAITMDGLSGALGGPSDQQRFAAARGVADAIVVGASTARLEDYRPAQVPIAVVTGSLSLEPSARLFGDPECKPLLITTDEAIAKRGGAFAGVAEVIGAGASISPAEVLGELDRRGMRVVVLEGGPTLNGQFAEADLIDELLLTVSPRLVGGDGPRLARIDSLDFDARFAVDRVLLADDLLFVRYLRTR